MKTTEDITEPVDLFGPLRSGLATTHKRETGTGWAMLGVATGSDQTLTLRAEVGHKLTDHLSLFAAAEGTSTDRWTATAGIGAKW